MTYFSKIALLSLFTSARFLSSSQSREKELPPGYYVTVAAYAESKEDFAQRYLFKLQSDGYDASYGFNSSKGLYFVYLKYFTNLKDGIRDMQATRKKGVFTDAWVRVVAGNIQAPAEIPVAELKERKQDNLVPIEKPSEGIQKDVIDSAGEITPNEEIVQYDPITLENTEVFLNLYNATNNRIIDGEIEVIDTERTRLIEKAKGNEYITMPDPKSKTGQLTFIAEVFGYRRIQHEINYKIPLADTVKSYIDLVGTTFVINFDMVRYSAGDIATLYQVYFYNDAAIMLPESRYQLEELLALMNENANYRIRLHGHTNGNYTGKIVSLGPSQDFFSLQNDVVTTTGSAKHLSELRADVIRDYLITKGNKDERIEIKAWGGKRPIYDKKSANAKKNVRVEVEILQD
jgi:outer membrane protein OmpA-like peptidoglycan-associated protein